MQQPPVFVQLRVENHLFFALKSKDSKKGEIVIAFVQFLCETVSCYGVNIIRWRVCIFAAVQKTSQNCKTDK